MESQFDFPPDADIVRTWAVHRKNSADPPTDREHIYTRVGGVVHELITEGDDLGQWIPLKHVSWEIRHEFQKLDEAKRAVVGESPVSIPGLDTYEKPEVGANDDNLSVDEQVRSDGGRPPEVGNSNRSDSGIFPNPERVRSGTDE